MTLPLPTLNLGIVAHVDAGKTSLTERLLYEAGAIDAPGSVDAGTTRTDSLDLERRRGITIRAAVTSFRWDADVDPLVVNLLDTPGHPDFIAEVERSLGVLDAAVLVLSSVEGVQPQTVVIWRALQRIGVPTVLFVNKVDRSGADVDRVVEQVRRRLTPYVVPLSRVQGAGTRAARVTEVPYDDESVVTAVAEADDGVLQRWATDRAQHPTQVADALRRGVRDGSLTPLLCGSAITGAGLPGLRAALASLLPRAETSTGALAGTVFAVDRDERGRRAWVRLWAGELRVRDRVAFGAGEPARLTEVAVSSPDGPDGLRAGVARAGQIAVVRGPAARIGDTTGRPPARRTHRFTPATLQALVEPEDPTRRTALYAGLTELADEDPLIDLRLDEVDGEAAVSLHGEVQKEVLAALLEERYDVRVRFLQTSVVCLERVVGTGTATEQILVADNPYLAGLGLRIEAATVGHGVGFSPGVERGNLPPAFVAATEEGVRAALRQGPHGWEVTDCVVTMTSSAYWPRQSRPHQRFDKSISTVAADFRHLAPVVVAAALAGARTRVCRPVDRFELDLPETAYAAVAGLLGRLGAVLLETATSGGYARLVGHLPSTAVPDVAARLPDLTGGEGVLVTGLDHHAPVAGVAPRRRRHGPDPLDRAAWFRDVPR
ncbi:elongation factor G [Nocardioides plantarum]|uniref:GTP-binding protein n=1 Tax=Nocardioides plantarum TaxID=29299 RepID=A0ABV5K5A3_9ACTN|nr:TetM/TetW/TetO/TetS family tetracycline resistance ribosomal protection protein [Nocardioides plantarum]